MSPFKCIFLQVMHVVILFWLIKKFVKFIFHIFGFGCWIRENWMGLVIKTFDLILFLVNLINQKIVVIFLEEYSNNASWVVTIQLLVLYRFINTEPQNTTDKECLQKQGDSLIILTVVAGPLKSIRILNFRSGIQHMVRFWFWATQNCPPYKK